MRRDYSQNKRSNSLFRRRERKIRAKSIKAKIKLVIFFIFILTIIAGIFYFIFGSYLRVTKIKVNGNQEVKSPAILSFINDELNQKSLIPKNNYLFIKEDDLSQKIKEHFYFEEVTSKKTFPNELSINLTERSPKFIIVIDNKNYFLDKSGIIIRKVTEENNNKLIHITDISNTEILFNYPLISTEEINHFNAITDYLLKTDYKVQTLEKNKFNDLTAIMENNFKIYFNLNQDIQKQINKLDSILKESKENSEYIDVRFSNKVYYK
ncbi:FtsQ-type POTRA domain-containing protein [Candidatus Falkowbacteria bacterium]|jgi:cell division septal protein FtsQ|nr:FtsQ-type POTRA domain-containing protein [Candidatus Falkowbacteria bacterium]MBT4433106.1 FtsQ-type POTRA domain-containing protein [Candidatus Falkowbacteria bacterium]